MRILVFTNLWPSSLTPTHGSFIEERWRRIVARTDWQLRVIHPVPRYPRLPGSGRRARHTRLPEREVLNGVAIEYPRYFHVPRFGTGRQAARMQRGARRCFEEVVQEFRPDLVDAQYLWPDACAAIPLALPRRIPVVATARGSDVNVLPQNPTVRRSMQRILPRATQLLAVSPALSRELAALLEQPQESVQIAPNGVDAAAFVEERERVPRRLICVARLLPAKAQPLLLEAMATLAPRSCELVLVGGGERRRELEARASALGISESVCFTGELSREAVAEELVRSSLFVFPSRREGWPNAVLEALASGLPVLACGIGGIPDIARGCQAVRLLPLEAGAEDWARAIEEELGRLEQHGDSLREAARRRARELDWESVIETLVNCYANAREKGRAR